MNRPLSFRKENRIRKRPEFQALFKTGFKKVTRYFFLYVRPAGRPAGAKASRIGISVPGRLGGAVFRNREKRVLREYFRKLKNTFPLPLEMVVVMSRVPPDAASRKRDLDGMFQWLSGYRPLSAR